MSCEARAKIQNTRTNAVLFPYTCVKVFDLHKYEFISWHTCVCVKVHVRVCVCMCENVDVVVCMVYGCMCIKNRTKCMIYVISKE